MTDKLPEWVESWIDDNELFGVVDAQLIRAFLAQYVLCEREPAGYLLQWSDGTTREFKRSAPPEKGYKPLHAPAKEEV